jgi:hypothetical protein
MYIYLQPLSTIYTEFLVIIFMQLNSILLHFLRLRNLWYFHEELRKLKLNLILYFSYFTYIFSVFYILYYFSAFTKSLLLSLVLFFFVFVCWFYKVIVVVFSYSVTFYLILLVISLGLPSFKLTKTCLLFCFA